ncbi:periplasmic solute binding family domain protein [Brucella abortus bv. 4 str. 292]|nr:periplasmic solute binding family domain protein [Brucella abortus bv. 4 str. 292]
MLDSLGIGGFQTINMLGPSPLNDQLRLTHALHDGGNNRVKRLDRNNHALTFACKGRTAKASQKGRSKKQGMQIFHGISLEQSGRNIIFA